MPRSSIFLLVGALVLGVVAVIIARFFLMSTPAPLQAAAPIAVTRPVAVAVARIAFGTPITASLIKFADFPVASIPDGAFKTAEDVVGKGDRRALREIEAGEIVLLRAVSGSSVRLSSSGTIAPGMRAAAVKLSDVAGVGGLLQPGDHVDVIVTRSIVGSTDIFTDVLIQNVRVLALDQDTSQSRDEAAAVKVATSATIEVSVVQAQKLALAQIAGNVGLVLRSVEDLAPLPVRTVRLSDLRDGSGAATLRTGVARPSPRRLPAPPAPRRVEVFHGTESTMVTVPDGSGSPPAPRAPASPAATTLVDAPYGLAATAVSAPM